MDLMGSEHLKGKYFNIVGSMRSLPVFDFIFTTLVGQNDLPLCEAEVKKEVENFSKRKNTTKHSFSQLLSLNQTDPNYSYKFGVCMLFTNSDKEKDAAFEKAERSEG